MKKSILVILAALLAVPAFSQIKFGLKAGAETTTVPTYDVTSGTSNIEAVKNSQWGWHAGAFVRISFLGLYVQPEAVFASNSFDYNVTEVQGNPAVLKTQKFNRLSVPILLGIKVGPIRLNAGPAASVKISSPSELVTGSTNWDELYKGAVWGYQAGLGIDLFKKLTLDARYAGSFGEQFGSTINIGSQSYKVDNSAPSFILSVGFMF